MPDFNWYTAIHLTAIFAKGVQAHEGSPIMDGVVAYVNVIGIRSILNTSTSENHKIVLGNAVISSSYRTFYSSGEFQICVHYDVHKRYGRLPTYCHSSLTKEYIF